MDSFDTSLIEGIWKFNSDNTYYMTDGSIIEGPLPNICGDQLTIEINADNSIESIELHTDNCITSTDNLNYFGWEHLGNGEFKFYKRSVNNQSVWEIKFEISFPSSNTMKLHNVAPGTYNFESFNAIDYNLTKQ